MERKINKKLNNIKSIKSSKMMEQSGLLRKKMINDLSNIIIEKILKFDNNANKIEIYKKMLKRGMHYGHNIVKCHPEMRRFTKNESNNKNLINLIQTKYYLKKCLWTLAQLSYKQKNILFVGTTIPSSRFIGTAAIKTRSFFVNVRWLGGMLTNWKTIKKLIIKLHNLQKEQKSKIFKNLPKKQAAARQKERLRLEKYLKGIALIQKFPEIIIMTSQKRDISAALECQKLGITNFSIVDTDCDPRLADYIIPANDDSASSIKFILYYYSKAIRTGLILYNMRERLKKQFKISKLFAEKSTSKQYQKK
uniref:Small ribosomal subunit protein uS2c n=1 Tax=Oedocladium carolinianum TaxID=55992 RepID=A0A1D8GX94_9CHLO|nr:ribosomal protein S2 [Oedocladium carolinianum]AOT84332.1 ribosomal protein S2 [Oedocladium carolinianum]